jgi:hypothetical protein
MTSGTLHRTNINLYEADCLWLEHRYGYGWTNQIRDLVHDWVRQQRREPEDTPREYARDKITRANPKDLP